MPVFAKNLAPLTKGGKITKFAGKGSQSAPMSQRGQLNALAKPAGQSMQNYAKATPMSAAPMTAGPGSGSFPGVGG
jgi:hypothetical protein